MVSRVLAYTLAGLPAVVGVWFIADYAFATSDNGWSAAGQLGLVALTAYAGPAFALAVSGKGRKVAGFVLGCIAVGALIVNWTQTLDALANRGAGKLAEMSKLASTVGSDRARLGRLEGERATLPNVSASDEAVRAAQAAVASAERIHAAECGNGDPKQHGLNCRKRATEEQEKRDALAKVLGEKATADKAARLDKEIAQLNARLDKAPAVKETTVGTTLGRLLSLPAIAAATLQQQVLSAIVELAIAASLALPELLRSERPARARTEPEPVPAVAEFPALEPAKQRSIAGVVLAETPKPEAMGDLRAFMLACLPRAQEGAVMLRSVYARYQRWCSEQLPPVAPLDATAFGTQFRATCERVKLRSERRGDKVYCLGVRLIA